MIIKREYVTFGTLAKDKVTGDLMRKAIKESQPDLSENKIDEMLYYIREVIFNQAELGCGIRGEAYQKMREMFTKLDNEIPFDNGLTYRDVTDVITFPNKEGNEMTQWLIRKENSDYCNEIVQVIAFKNSEAGIVPIEPWFPGHIIF